jgi:hypothetical protein
MALDFGLLGAPPDMTASTNAGFDRGLQMAMFQKAQEDKAKQLELQNAQQLAQQELMTKAIGGDVMAQSQYAAMHAKSSEDAIKAFSTLGNPERNALRTEAYQIDTLARTNPAAAKQMLADKLMALENSNQKDPKIQQKIANIKAMTLIPDSVLPAITASMVHMADPDGAEKYFKTVSERELQPSAMRTARAKAGQEEALLETLPQSEQAKIDESRARISEMGSRQQLARLEYNLKAARDPLEQQKIQAEIDALSAKTGKIENPNLSPALAKMVNQFSDDAVGAQNDAAQARDVIGKLTALDPSLATRLLPANLRGALGMDYQDVAHQFEQLGVKLVQANKPGAGPLSDKDLAFMQKPVPTDTSSTKTKVNYLKKFAEIQDKAAMWGDVKSQWVTQNGNLGALTRPLILPDGTKIDKGMTLAQTGALIRQNEIKPQSKTEDFNQSAAGAQKNIVVDF